ncbi:MAG: hypothetical protein E7351_03025 [Clostridiales bacterium]|nr:hypothetical protein [Clostridiales bacterium]
MTKVNERNWSLLDFLINNFYEVVEYKRGRGVYGDRVILKRPRMSESVFGEPTRLCEFYYMDANAVKELPRTIIERIKVITRFITTPEDMNVLCDFVSEEIEPTEWALETKRAFSEAKTLDFKVLNDILVERYKLLDSSFLSKLNKHREKQYFLVGSDGFNLITKDYANEQISKL